MELYCKYKSISCKQQFEKEEYVGECPYYLIGKDHMIYSNMILSDIPQNLHDNFMSYTSNISDKSEHTVLNFINKFLEEVMYYVGPKDSCKYLDHCTNKKCWNIHTIHEQLIVKYYYEKYWLPFIKKYCKDFKNFLKYSHEFYEIYYCLTSLLRIDNAILNFWNKKHMNKNN